MVVKPPDGSAVPAGAGPGGGRRGAPAVARATARSSSICRRVDLTPPEPPAWLKWLAELFSGLDFEAPAWLRSLFDFFEGVAPGLGTVFYVMLAHPRARRAVLHPPVRRRAAGGTAGGAGRRGGSAARCGPGPRPARRGGRARRARPLSRRPRTCSCSAASRISTTRRPDLVRPAFTSRDIAALERDPGPAALRLRADRDDGRAQPVRPAAAGRGRLARLPRGL